MNYDFPYHSEEFLFKYEYFNPLTQTTDFRLFQTVRRCRQRPAFMTTVKSLTTMVGPWLPLIWPCYFLIEIHDHEIPSNRHVLIISKSSPAFQYLLYPAKTWSYQILILNFISISGYNNDTHIKF